MSHTLRFFLVVTVLLCGVSAGTAQAGVLMHPVAPGQSYRLAFVTDGVTAATATDITTYDMFVNDEANLSPLTQPLGLTWKVIGSTPFVNAIDHIGPFNEPIYLVDKMTRIAANSTDLWDGSIEAPIALTQFGVEVVPPVTNGEDPYVWTGTDPDGQGGGILFALGGIFGPRFGNSFQNNGRWIFEGSGPGNVAYPLYALSTPITVPDPGNGAAVPEPASVAVWSCLVGFGLLGASRRRKRHDQKSQPQV